MLDRGWCENFQCFCSISCKKCGFIASGPVWICSKICILCFFYFAFAFCVFYFVFFLSCILTGKDCHRISDDESQVATGGQDLPKSDFCHFQHTICNFLTTYHCPATPCMGFHTSVINFTLPLRDSLRKISRSWERIISICDRTWLPWRRSFFLMFERKLAHVLFLLIKKVFCLLTRQRQIRKKKK